MNSLSRTEKIKLLKDIMAGKNPKLPDPSTSIAWQYDGSLFIEQQGATQETRRGGLRFTKEAFVQHICKTQRLAHIVFDDTGQLAAAGFDTLRAISAEESYNHDPFLIVLRNILPLEKNDELPLPKSIACFIQ